MRNFAYLSTLLPIRHDDSRNVARCWRHFLASPAIRAYHRRARPVGCVIALRGDSGILHPQPFPTTPSLICFLYSTVNASDVSLDLDRGMRGNQASAHREQSRIGSATRHNAGELMYIVSYPEFQKDFVRVPRFKRKGSKTYHQIVFVRFL